MVYIMGAYVYVVYIYGGTLFMHLLSLLVGLSTLNL
jgi:hypothetical protein